jgi:hypothetical protein
MKSYITGFAIVAPIMALIIAPLDFALACLRAIFMDSPYPDPSTYSWVENLFNGAEIAFVLGILAIILMIITHFFIKKPQFINYSHILAAVMGFVALGAVVVPLVPVILLFVKG